MLQMDIMPVHPLPSMDPLDLATVRTPRAGNLKEGSHPRGAMWMIMFHLQVQRSTRLSLQASLLSRGAKGKDTNRDVRQTGMNSMGHTNSFRDHHRSILPNRRESSLTYQPISLSTSRMIFSPESMTGCPNAPLTSWRSTSSRSL